MVKICYRVAIISQKQNDIFVKSFVKWFDLGQVTTQRISSFVFAGEGVGKDWGIENNRDGQSVCVCGVLRA